MDESWLNRSQLHLNKKGSFFEPLGISWICLIFSSNFHFVEEVFKVTLKQSFDDLSELKSLRLENRNNIIFLI